MTNTTTINLGIFPGDDHDTHAELVADVPEDAEYLDTYTQLDDAGNAYDVHRTRDGRLVACVAEDPEAQAKAEADRDPACGQVEECPSAKAVAR